jgi:hypothetical protein
MLATDLGLFSAECHKFPRFLKKSPAGFAVIVALAARRRGPVNYNLLEGRCLFLCPSVILIVFLERSSGPQVAGA